MQDLQFLTRVGVAKTFARAVVTGLKSSLVSRSAAGSDKQSAPSAIARWERTTPGWCACQEIPQLPIATDIARVRPGRSASSGSSAVRAWETRFSPPAASFARRSERLRCTCKEPSDDGEPGSLELTRFSAPRKAFARHSVVFLEYPDE